MPRRQETYVVEQLPFLVFAGIICLWLYAGWSLKLLFVLGAVAGLALVIGHILRKRWTETHRKAQEIAEATEYIRAGLPRVFATIVRPHRESLARKRRILVKREENGTLVLTRWLGELSHFYKTTVLPELPNHHLTVGHPDLVVRLADETAFLDWFLTSDPLHWTADDFASGQPEPGMGPIEFEAWCRKALARAHWAARVAPAGAAQTPTILAERDGVTAAVQCRLSAQPVGTKAVQDVVAARRVYQRDVAVLVSNQGFVPLARSLATAEAVCLLHHSELEGIEPQHLLSAIRPRPAEAGAPQQAAATREPQEKVARVFGRR